MKWLPSFSLLLCFAVSGTAQPVIPPVPARHRVIEQPTPPPPANDKLTRFDLDFPGGTPGELAAAISKATGKHLNLIVPAGQADVPIMPLKISSVTVPYLFHAITQASNRPVPVRINGNIEYRDATILFLSDGGPMSDETVWSFKSTMPTKAERELLAGAPSAPSVCRYFQLASYLENYSIEDITTAIQTGWKMAKVDPIPQLSFHKETRLLIAVGPESSVNLIPAVLGQLQKDREATVEKMLRLQAELDRAQEKNEGEKAKQLRFKLLEAARRQKANEQIDKPESIFAVPPASR